jgi:dTMP kinase
MEGKLITLEGIDNSGKSTQAKKLYSYLRQKKLNPILIREPGGTSISEKIREILLSNQHNHLSPQAELLLYEAARAQLVAEVILPGLREGRLIVCDRFYDSTTAYQGFARGLKLTLVQGLNKFASQGIVPNLTILIDLPPKQALKRGKKSLGVPDRVEGEELKFHSQVRAGYLSLARRFPRRFKTITGAQPVEKIWQKVKSAVDNFLKLN